MIHLGLLQRMRSESQRKIEMGQRRAKRTNGTGGETLWIVAKYKKAPISQKTEAQMVKKGVNCSGGWTGGEMLWLVLKSTGRTKDYQLLPAVRHHGLVQGGKLNRRCEYVKTW